MSDSPERAESDSESNDDSNVADESSSDDEPLPEIIQMKPAKKAPKKRKKKKKNRVKKALSAYMFFSKTVRKDVAAAGNLSFAEIAREVSRRWKELSDEDKKPYAELNAQDKIRYKEELANAPPPEPDSDSDGQPKKKKKKIRDPNLPKRPKTAFFFYLDDVRKSVALEHPEMKMSERSKLLGKRWRELTDEEKVPYQEANTGAKVSYKIAMEEYNRKKAAEAGD